MNKRNLAYYPSDAEINEFYAGRQARAGEIFGCRYFAGAVGDGANASDAAGAGTGAAGDGAGAHRFCLWAPNAKSVSVVGDFSGWDAGQGLMERHRGLWIRFVSGARDGDNYKYRIEGADGVFVMKADPYAAHAETKPATASKVWDVSGYAWGDSAWLGARGETDPLRAPISIYELHLGSWRTKDGSEFPSFREIADELCAYAKVMGFTHVELMPVNEFPFDGSWGYQVTGFFAITSRFGTPQDFMYFVDTLHRAGIGVIVDWVPAHFPKDAHGLPHFDGSWLYEHQSPLRREHPQWGTYEFNYGRPEVVSFLISSAANLVERYHVDGLRVDAVSSMLYLDYGREGDFVRNKDGGNVDYDAVKFIKALNTAVLGGHPGLMTVAEESTTFPLVTKPPRLGGLGFTFKWNMGFMHDTLDYMKSDTYFRHGAHGKLTFSMSYAFSENYILPYSHDEVVHGKASMIGKMFGAYDEKFAALKTLYGWLYGHPGKKLLFMGAEFAQFIEWDYEKQLDWFLLEYGTHAGVQAWVRALNKLYKSRSALYAKDDSWEGFSWMGVDDRKNSVFAFLRSGTGTGAHVLCVYNFSRTSLDGYDVALPGPGKLTLLLSSDDRAFGGSGLEANKTKTARKKGLNGQPCSATLTLPPSSALFYEYRTGNP
ncbi:MAG: 1,4-alpha-glucan branching protein GlgB [Clostridiales Family XIII bacterium]|nr:1,4-alpha-glucan branching protein GlgB [Clostridiales Family XIII bacterium]